jgi:hypothetical protein
MEILKQRFARGEIDKAELKRSAGSSLRPKPPPRTKGRLSSRFSTLAQAGNPQQNLRAGLDVRDRPRVERVQRKALRLVFRVSIFR